ncbi:hypothetical protein LTR05_007856 [Lithohypha guttulata]|uniref:Uncharacterized protein n=1 Tax=Lithohypha guttulata TaxID=1690604 RepID=A0AAN7SUB8_9EURO|nr:hypothetical protein LTR05_007856 [Lithohypha guttulata]
MNAQAPNTPKEPYDWYNSKCTRLMSEIRAVGHQEQPSEVQAKQGQPFVAARLPLMSRALPSEDSDEGGVLLPSNNTPETKTILPPIVTTTSTYILPKPPTSYRIDSSHSNLTLTSNQNLVFPKLTMPRLIERISASTNADRAFSQASAPQNTAQTTKPATTPCTTCTPASISKSSRLRGNASSNGSLDTCFNVVAATESRCLLNPASTTSAEAIDGTHALRTQQPDHRESSSVACTPAAALPPPFRMCAWTYFRPEYGTEIGKMVDWICDDIEAQAQAQSAASNRADDQLESDDVKESSASNSLTASQLLSQNLEGDEEEISALPSDAKDLPRTMTCESEEESEICFEEVSEDGEGWSWDDDLWETASPSPASEVDTMLGVLSTW